MIFQILALIDKFSKSKYHNGEKIRLQNSSVSSDVVPNGVEWFGVKWCCVSVMTLELLVVLSQFLRNQGEECTP